MHEFGRKPKPEESLPKEVVAEVGQVSVSELIELCNAAVRDLEDHRQLVYNCAWALRQLSDRIAELEGDNKALQTQFSGKPS